MEGDHGHKFTPPTAIVVEASPERWKVLLLIPAILVICWAVISFLFSFS